MPHTEFASRATMSWRELQLAGLGQHVMLLVEDWNEPDTWTVGISQVLITKNVTCVVTPTRMTYRGVGSNPDQHSDDILIASYQAPNQQPVDVACFAAEDGKLAYATGGAA